MISAVKIEQRQNVDYIGDIPSSSMLTDIYPDSNSEVAVIAQDNGSWVIAMVGEQGTLLLHMDELQKQKLRVLLED